MPFPLSNSRPHSSEHKLEQAKVLSVVWASLLVLVMAKPKSLLNRTGHAWHKTYLWLIWLTSKPLWLLAMVLCFLFRLSRIKLLICKYLKLRRFSLETELVDRQNLVLSITIHFTQSMSQLVLQNGIIFLVTYFWVWCWTLQSFVCTVLLNRDSAALGGCCYHGTGQ